MYVAAQHLQSKEWLVLLTSGLTDCWGMQTQECGFMWLAALACLSLAAKLEEVGMPSTISALQVCLLGGYAEMHELKPNFDARHDHRHHQKHAGGAAGLPRYLAAW